MSNQPLSPLLRVLLDIARTAAERQAKARRGKMRLVTGGKGKAA